MESREDFEARIERLLIDLTRRVYRIEQALGLTSPLPRPAPPASREAPPAGALPASGDPLPVRSEALPADREALPAGGGEVPPVRPAAPSFREPLHTTTPAEATAPTSRKPSIDWENWVGAKWTLWVGSLAVFLALAFFLAYAWQYFNPSERIGLGLLAGIAFLAAGEYFRGRAQPWFGEGLSGTGLALLYLTIWAGNQVYPMLAPLPAFAAMCTITAIGVVQSIRHDAEGLSVLASLGGFLTPFLLHGTNVSVLFFYVGVLDTGILAVSLFKRWSGLKWLSFVATMLLFIGTIQTSSMLSVSLRYVYFICISGYYLLFLGTSCFYSLARREPTRPGDLLLLFVDTSTYVLATYALHLQSRFPAGFPLVLVAFYIALAYLVKIRASENLLLRNTLLGIAVFFFTVAIPLQLGERELAVGWSVEAALLITLASRFRISVFQKEGWLVWLLSVGATLSSLLAFPSEPHLILLNQRALPLLVGVLASGWMAVYAHRREAEFPDLFAPLYASLAAAGGAWLIAQETYLAFSWNAVLLGENWQAGALYAIAALWGLYAVFLLYGGLKLDNRVARVGGGCVAALSLALPILVTGTQHTDWTPFFNLRFFAYAVAAISLWIMGILSRRGADTLEGVEQGFPRRFPVFACLTGLWGLTVEIYAALAWARWPSPDTWQAAALFTVTLFWCLAAVILFSSGLSRERDELRRLALWVAAAAVGLLFYTAAGFSPFTWPPFLNLRFFAFAFVTGMAAAFSRLMGRNRGKFGAGEKGIVNLSGVLAFLVSLFGLSIELHVTFFHFSIPSRELWPIGAHFGSVILWGAYAALLVHLGFFRNKKRYRRLSYFIGGIAILSLWIGSAYAPVTSDYWLAHFEFLAFAAITTLLVYATIIAHANREKLGHAERWMLTVPLILAVVVGLWGLTRETYGLAYYHQNLLGQHWDRAAEMGISLVWTLCGAGLLVGGIIGEKQAIRLVALSLLGLTVLKMFLFDLRFLPTPYRVLSFGGLGAALIAISWLYSRFGGKQDRGTAT